MREQFRNTFEAPHILGRSNKFGWSPIPTDAPPIVQKLIREYRERVLAGKPVELRFTPTGVLLIAEQRVAVNPTLVDDTEEETEGMEGRDQCMCDHCSPTGTPEDEYDDECTTDDCERCVAMARTRAALAL